MKRENGKRDTSSQELQELDLAQLAAVRGGFIGGLLDTIGVGNLLGSFDEGVGEILGGDQKYQTVYEPAVVPPGYQYVQQGVQSVLK